MDPKVTRHWIRAFHRMTLHPRTPPSGSQSGRISDAPLFTRRAAGRRWPFNSATHDAPKYRIAEGHEELFRLDKRFNPFKNYPAIARGVAVLPEGQESDSRDSLYASFWTIDSLPLVAQRRVKVLRIHDRPFRNTDSSMSLDDSPGGSRPVNTSASPSWITENKDLSHPLSKEAWPFAIYKLDLIQSSLVNNLIDKIKESSSTITQQEFSTDLQELGRATLLRWGLPSVFVDAPANQQDVIGTGLDTLISTLPYSTDNLWAGPLVGLLKHLGMLQIIDKACLACLHYSVYHPRPEVESGRARGRMYARLREIEKIQKMRNATRIDIDEWRIQTRRFRLQLAMARETGIMPSELEYVKFMKSCQRAGQARELEMTFNHYLDYHQNVPRQDQSLQQQQQQPWQRQQQKQQRRLSSLDEDDDEVEQEGEHPSEKIFREYIKGLARQGRMDHAQEVFNSMKRRGVSPSLITFGTMLDGYGRSMNLSKMRAILKSLYSAGKIPSLEIYTSLIGNYIRAGALERADQVYRQLMSRTDLHLDGQSRNVIDHLLRLGGGRGVNASSPLVAGVVDKYGSALETVIHYNHRLKRYVSAMNMPQFVVAYKQLMASGASPNTTTYNILIDALLLGGQIEDGVQVLEHMKASGSEQPDVVTYSTLIHHAVQGHEVELGWSLYSEMRERSIEPTLHTYVSLIELVGLDPTNKTGRAIVRQYGNRGGQRVRFPVKASVEDEVGLKFAGELYNQLCDQGLSPNEHVFGAMLDMTIRGGYIDLAHHVFLEMTYKNVEPNSAIMTMLIKGFAIRRDFESGWRVWKHMLQANIPRNVITYHHLIRLCERSLPNPILMAEILDTPSPAHDTTEETTQKDEDTVISVANKSTKEQKQQEKEWKQKVAVMKQELENTARIPLEVLMEIKDQMNMDHIHWSRIQQFRTHKVDSNIWDPIVKQVGPVMEVTEENAEAVDAFVASLEGTNLVSTTNTRVNADDESSVPGTMIREMFSGGGNEYLPKRAPRPKMVLKWDASNRMPILNKNYDAELASNSKGSGDKIQGSNTRGASEGVEGSTAASASSA
ncbi:hypothetical protein BGZ98_006828 [Dissophora globulifera]|nr:hypothetical protein BGZ98_006828 [Dissophora globulifera]